MAKKQATGNQRMEAMTEEHKAFRLELPADVHRELRIEAAKRSNRPAWHRNDRG